MLRTLENKKKCVDSLTLFSRSIFDIVLNPVFLVCEYKNSDCRFGYGHFLLQKKKTGFVKISKMLLEKRVSESTNFFLFSRVRNMIVKLVKSKT